VSVALVTADTACKHLRIESGSEPNIDLYIEAVSKAVISYLGSGADEFLDTSGFVPADTSGPLNVPADVAAAALLWLGFIYENRSGEVGDNKDAFSFGDPPFAVKALLYRKADLSFA
jgi:hypothetical protein